MTQLRWLLAGLALQNVGRRKARTALLAAAVAISCAIVFAGGVMLRSIAASMAVGFSRLGADLMVVQADALTNITAALLAVEPTDQTIQADLFGAPIAGVARVAPQRVFRTDQAGFGGHGESVDLIGFDSERDFTVLPWIAERLGRRMQSGDVIVGAARDLPVGSEIVLFGRTFRIYARLGRTGVGTHERGIFMTSDDLLGLAPYVRERLGRVPPMLQRDRVSGFLVEIAPGATELQVRFALLSRLSGIKVVAGETLLTGVRQGLEALLDGTLALVVMTSASTVIMVCVLFSAIVEERRSELGLLKAIGARRRQSRRTHGDRGNDRHRCRRAHRSRVRRTAAASVRAIGGLSSEHAGHPVSLARHSGHRHDRGGMHRGCRIDRRGGSAGAGLACEPP